MPAWRPVSRRELVAALRVGLLAVILRQAGVSRKQWERI
jgi:hypothetical protein